MICWDRPRYPGFSTYSSRLRSFGKGSWPPRNVGPMRLALRDYSILVMTYAYGLLKTNIKSVLILLYTIQYLSVFHLLTGHADETRCFHRGDGLRAGLMMIMTHGRSMKNGSRTASTFVTWWRGLHNSRMMITTWRSINVLFCNVQFWEKINMTNREDFNIWFYSLPVVLSLANNTNTKCSCTYFKCGLVETLGGSCSCR